MGKLTTSITGSHIPIPVSIDKLCLQTSHRIVFSIHNFFSSRTKSIKYFHFLFSPLELEPESKYEVKVVALTEDGQISHSAWVSGNTTRESYMNGKVTFKI